MKNCKFLLFIFSLLAFFNANATHIIGGEIYYDYQGNNNYKIYIAVYRDCATISGAPYDNPLALAVYDANRVLVRTVSVPFPGSVVLPIAFSNPCVVTPSGFCNEKAVYTTTINLPPTAGGYTLAYQRCCRRPDVINITNPGDTGLTLVCHIPGTSNNNYMNSSARFTNYPPLVLCNNDVLNFNHSATDPDGDQLVYELITPFAGATGTAPQPSTPPPPPYFPVNWANGFTAANPFGPGATISINPTTGQLLADPELLGMFVVGVRVKEYRNGELISQTDRDFIFKVINCNISLEAKITPQSQMTTFVSFCEGTTITFQNQSYGATSYHWDFGVPGTDTDVSTQFTPTYTFPAPGIYNVTLIANPGWPCTDTSVQVFEVREHLVVHYTVQDSICLKNNSFDFDGSFSGPAGTTFIWNFGPNASIPSSTLLDVNNVSFTQSGFIPVTLTGNFSTCTKTYKDSIYIYPQSVADFNFMPSHECEGFTQTFTNNSTFAGVSQWDFGVPGITDDVSTQNSPTYTYPTPGTFPVTLIVSNGNQCTDTLQKMITVYEPLLVAFTHNDSLCITDNSFNFNGTVSGPPSTVIAWNFGPNASIQTSNQEDVNNVVYDSGGTFPVTLTASFNQCSKTVTSSVRVFKIPTIDFTIKDDLRCAPHTAQFLNFSTSETPMQYFWNFGDGGTSNLQNPSHIYNSPGIYSVTLSVVTIEGCKDTLSLYKPDLVRVHPTPVSKFSVSPLITDICHADVNFSDLSTGATQYFYNFDDIGQTSTEKNPAFTYLSSGQKRPMQIVSNDFGCKDTSYAQLYIEPFTVYIPNTFTPDGNEHNNIFNAVIYLEVQSWLLKVYDRWGELLFSSNDPQIGWDGTYGDKIAQDGTYVYVLKYVSCEDAHKEHVLRGHVNLLK